MKLNWKKPRESWEEVCVADLGNHFSLSIVKEYCEYDTPVRRYCVCLVSELDNIRINLTSVSGLPSLEKAKLFVEQNEKPILENKALLQKIHKINHSLQRSAYKLIRNT